MGIVRNDFSQGSIPKTITRLALPMIGAQFINALYNIVDRMFIGRIPGEGTLALTGLGVCFPLIMIISAFSSLFGNGGAPLCSIARGAGDNERAERIMGNGFSMLLISGVVLTIVCLIFQKPLLYAFGASDATYKYAGPYMTIYILGSVFVMIALGMNPYIQSQGFAKTGMLTVALGAVLNIILDPIFIFVFNMGVSGAALATIISQLASAIWALYFLFGKKCILKLSRQTMRPDPAIIKKIVALGVSPFIMNVTNSAVSIVSNTSLYRYGGDVYIGIMTVISSARQIMMMPIMGFSNGAQPVIGYNYGALKLQRVRQSIKFMILVCLAAGIVTWAIVQCFPAAIMRIFNNDEEFVRLGVPAVRLFFMMQIFMGLQMAGQCVFVALDKAKQATFFSMLRKVFIVVPLVYILPSVFNMGVMGVFAAEPVSDVVGSSACFITMMLTVWPKLKDSTPLPPS